MALKDLIFGLILTGLFMFSLIGFGVILGQDNPSNHSITDDPDIQNYRNSIQENLTTYATDNSEVNSTWTAFAGSVPFLGSFVVATESVFGVWQQMTKVPKLMYDLTIGYIWTKVFGGTGGGYSLTISILTALILLSILFAIYKWWKTGEYE